MPLPRTMPSGVVRVGSPQPGSCRLHDPVYPTPTVCRTEDQLEVYHTTWTSWCGTCRQTYLLDKAGRTRLHLGGRKCSPLRPKRQELLAKPSVSHPVRLPLSVT